jgi:hypothetical protein
MLLERNDFPAPLQQNDIVQGLYILHEPPTSQAQVGIGLVSC